MNLIEKLNSIQMELNASFGAFTRFGKYNYGGAESILQAVEPLLEATDLVLTVSDSIEVIGGRSYIKATAKISDGATSLETEAYAREPEAKKGRDESPIAGATSSYARKYASSYARTYALCVLFAINDNKDADATNTHDKEPPKREGCNDSL